jgi:hypothetical protein
LQHNRFRDKLLRQRANISDVISRPRPLSVAEAAASIRTSEAYVRRQLLTGRLYGMKIGPVWAIYEEDLDSFARLRRPPGRPRKGATISANQAETRVHITSERATAGTDDALLRPRRRQGSSARKATQRR